MTTRTVFVSRRLQCGAAIALVMIVTLMIGVTVSVLLAPAPEESREEVLKVYVRLVWLSKSLDKMGGEVRELDELLTRNWVRLETRMWLQEEVNELGREYAETAGEYNRSMRETGYRFADPAKLPAEAKFGPLPRRHEPFILLKSGPRA
ncbi:MAG: hypothetical protein UY36_C0007G0007 [Parcubacteria group bacterium GW2011_GWA1_49_11]|nr:MAG: hypothetical protein UY36_C0007G0007 [Parcubacteria group bacterium GW2011_GWA1_49_11]